jgi:carbon monoxide dehydrogenase subunit G
MKLEGEHIFHGPQPQVWALIRNPEALAKALPGAESLTRLSENEYEGSMNVRIGPVSGAFSGKVLISDEVAPESCTLTAEGKGAQGFAKGVGHVQLTDLGDGTTRMAYEGDVQIGGKLASVGQRSLDTVSRSMIRQGLTALDNALAAQMAAETAGEATVEYHAPTQVEFAAAVARDVAKEVAGELKARAESSPLLRCLLVVVPLLIVPALIGYLMTRRCAK